MDVKASRRGHIGVTEEPGNRGHSDAALDRTRGKGMANRVKLHLFQAELPEDPEKMMLEIVGIQHLPVAAEEDEIIRLRNMPIT